MVVSSVGVMCNTLYVGVTSPLPRQKTNDKQGPKNKKGVARAIGKGYNIRMMCTVCGLTELTGKQEKYCSKNCERKAWRDNNKEKLLASKKRYRDTNKSKILLYNRLYKKRVPKIKSVLSIQLRKAYSCLRCGTNQVLEVHHIKHQDYGGEPNDLNNLVVLCKPCHAKWHKYFNKDYWKVK